MNVMQRIDARWWALIVLCLGELMIVLDTTIVNVALPSIRVDLGFSESALAWVVNAYILTFGGFLLLGGRLGDLYGNRRLFILGISFFTLASLACGLATSQFMLIAARAVQGIGGAITGAVALSLIMSLFTETAERVKAMGVIGFISAGGGSVGVLLGGLLTTLNWHWVFLVNIPIGLLVVLLSIKLLPHSKAETEHNKLDAWGALTVTSALLLIVYSIIGGNEAGWTSPQTLGILGAGAGLLVLFFIIESNISSPLMPLRMLRMRNIALSNIAGMLWAAAMFAWFFISALYLQIVLHYTPLQVGLAFLPSNLIMMAFSLGLSAKIVMRFGVSKPLAAGLGLAGLGLLLLARAPMDANFWLDILPSMLILGVGAGIAFNPMFLAAMSDVDESESGLASGLVNTSFMMGGALGLAILASIAAAVTSGALAGGAEQIAALTSGYHAAFVAGALCAFVAAVLATFLRVSLEKAQQLTH